MDNSPKKKHKWPKTFEEMLNILGHKENANQKETDSTSLSSEWLSPITQTTNVGKDARKKEPLSTFGGNIN
jgi:hypothetical protein